MALRRQVLNAFKKCHRARQTVFKGDTEALAESRKSINQVFRANMHEKDENKIKEQLQIALDSEKMLRTCVIQAVQQENGNFRLRITEDTLRLDNVPFRDDAVPETQATKCKPCDGEDQTPPGDQRKAEKP